MNLLLNNVFKPNIYDNNISYDNSIDRIIIQKRKYELHKAPGSSSCKNSKMKIIIEIFQDYLYLLLNIILIYAETRIKGIFLSIKINKHTFNRYN
jgi:hypothetical protein